MENGTRGKRATGKPLSYYIVFWHVADVPGVQGERRGVALPPLPGRGAVPHTYQPIKYPLCPSCPL